MILWIFLVLSLTRSAGKSAYQGMLHIRENRSRKIHRQRFVEGWLWGPTEIWVEFEHRKGTWAQGYQYSKVDMRQGVILLKLRYEFQVLHLVYLFSLPKSRFQSCSPDDVHHISRSEDRCFCKYQDLNTWYHTTRTYIINNTYYNMIQCSITYYQTIHYHIVCASTSEMSCTVARRPRPTALGQPPSARRPDPVWRARDPNFTGALP